MSDQISKIKIIGDKWTGYSEEEKISAMSEIINLLAKQEGIKGQSLKVVKLGPPNQAGFYSIIDDTIYLNDYTLNDDFEKIIECLAHLFRYKLQLRDITKGERSDLKESWGNYIYPWKESNSDEKLFWVSITGIKNSKSKIDWDRIKGILKF